MDIAALHWLSVLTSTRLSMDCFPWSCFYMDHVWVVVCQLLCFVLQLSANLPLAANAINHNCVMFSSQDTNLIGHSLHCVFKVWLVRCIPRKRTGTCVNFVSLWKQTRCHTGEVSGFLSTICFTLVMRGIA